MAIIPADQVTNEDFTKMAFPDLYDNDLPEDGPAEWEFEQAKKNFERHTRQLQEKIDAGEPDWKLASTRYLVDMFARRMDRFERQLDNVSWWAL